MDIADEKRHIEIFCCYARKDQSLLFDLQKHLKLWERLNIITIWNDTDIAPGTDWNKEITRHLKRAHIILFLVSPDFLASDYCYSTEMKDAMERYERGEVCVIPIILRYCAWEKAPFGKIQVLPTDTKPVISAGWYSQDEAFTDVAKGLWKVITTMASSENVNLGNISLAKQVVGTSEKYSRIWNVPYRRNPFFTGREDILSHLHTVLTASKVAALTQPQALSGLGGIGKTQTAVEYAYRHQNDYQVVLWAKADSYGVLLTDFVDFAYQLNLAERDEKKLVVVAALRLVAAVRHWLNTHTDWLLILDNVEDLEMVKTFLPQVGKGHVLLTTRAQALGDLAQHIDLEKMAPEVGALFLLCRAKIIPASAPLDSTSVTNQIKAREISEVMDGLPLALDQAGAYIEETKCSLSHYLALYQVRRAELLKRRGRFTSDHPASVTTTFSLSFEKIRRANNTASKLLQFCAFLDPDAIPEKIIIHWAYGFSRFSFFEFSRPYAKDHLELDEMIEELLKYSLVHRNPNGQTLSIHRLVQAVLKDRMTKRTKRMWEGRVVLTINRLFPPAMRALWSRCRHLLSHAQICLELIEQWKFQLLSTTSYEFDQSAQLLEKAGDYLRQNGRYKEAVLMYQQQLKIEEKRKKIWGKSSDSFDEYRVSNKLARIYTDQGKYSQAGELFHTGFYHQHRQAPIQQISLDDEYSHTGAQTSVTLLNHINRIFHDYPDLRDAATTNNIAKVLYAEGEYKGADLIFRTEVLTLWKKVELPMLIKQSDNYTLYLSGYACMNAAILNNEAVLLILTDQERAEASFKQALEMQREQLQLGSSKDDHPEVAGYLNNLASLYLLQGKYVQAEPLFQKALAIRKQCFGKEHPEVAISLNNLASLHFYWGKYSQAEPLYLQALEIQERLTDLADMDRVRVLKSYAILMQKFGQKDQATRLEQQAETILLAVQEQKNITQGSLLSPNTHQKLVWSHPGLHFAWCPPELY